jgi:hypothetical protein
MRVALATLLALGVLGLAAEAALAAQEGTAAREDRLVSVSLRDGNVLIGRITSEDAAQLVLLTSGGIEVKVPRAQIVKIEPVVIRLEPRLRESRFSRDDPNVSRLMFSPTGWPLGKGEGQFADYGVVFPGFAVGLTNNLSLMGGVSVIPGLGLGEQLIYVAPRLAFETSKTTAFSAGVLYGTVGESSDRAGAGIAFAVGTFGRRHASFSAGAGFGFITHDGELEMAKRPIIMLGGEVQLSNSVAFISENWLILDEGFSMNEQPFGLALRFFGDRISADFGVVLIGEVLEEGFPIPWLSFTYRFGGPK